MVYTQVFWSLTINIWSKDLKNITLKVLNLKDLQFIDGIDGMIFPYTWYE